jgi:branched-chain amino acid transport system permease protein
LDGETISVDRGTLHAIVGPNGSGKTTRLNAVSGLISVDDGRMEFDGHVLTRMSASARTRLGFAHTLQNPRLLDSM